MTQIHAASLPMALPGKDLIVQAKTGSGKTAAFALALLANLNARRLEMQAMVLKMIAVYAFGAWAIGTFYCESGQ